MAEEYSNITQTEFNSSSATLLRVHNNFIHYVNCLLVDRLDLCKVILDAQWKEVSPYWSEFPKSWQLKLKEVQTALEKTEPRFMGLWQIGKLNAPEGTIHKRRFLKELDYYEIIIRMMMEKKGMLLKTKANPGSAALNTK